MGSWVMHLIYVSADFFYVASLANPLSKDGDELMLCVMVADYWLCVV
jgi:hypothetical protein